MAYGISHVEPRVSALVAALLLGMVVSNVVGNRAMLSPGARFAARKVLRVGIALLGLRISLDLIGDVGWRGVLVAVAAVGVTLPFSVWFGRRLGVSPALSLLIGAGCGICGAAAVVAMEPIAEAKDEEAGFALATVTALGTIAMLAVPLIGHAPARPVGRRLRAVGGRERARGGAGGGAAGGVSAAALAVATIVKLTRVVLLVPVIVVTAVIKGRAAGKRGNPVPLFVACFLVAVAIRSTGVLSADFVASRDRRRHRAAGVRDGGARPDHRLRPGAPARRPAAGAGRHRQHAAGGGRARSRQRDLVDSPPVEIRDTLVLVTGASRGIGLATAEAFHAEGARLVLVARDTDALHAAAARFGATALPADLTDPAALEGLIDRAGPVDILVNNAGMDITKPLWEHSAEELRMIMQLNLLTAMELTRQALPGMIARKRGRIVNVSSLSGVVSLPGYASYGASKAGLTHFTSCLNADLRGVEGHRRDRCRGRDRCAARCSTRSRAPTRSAARTGGSTRPGWCATSTRRTSRTAWCAPCKRTSGPSGCRRRRRSRPRSSSCRGASSA